MDAAFREATLKGPLWEEVSRKLGELGYRRSAKKCKEKFENVHKYYKRTKENRAGRQDGKSYRFFSQLEALGASSSSGSPAPTTIGFAAGAAAMAGPSAARIQPAHISAAAPPPPIVTPVRAATEIGHGGTIQGISGSTTPTTPPQPPSAGSASRPIRRRRSLTIRWRTRRRRRRAGSLMSMVVSAKGKEGPAAAAAAGAGR
uniref:Myb/SANT-like DNA-binding domain-containing protein n=1 Tax=Ananas comosus var. bracteatus TaxID=296719 RepID=A0A6V7QMW6_ANACO|nr:unnamed protein product [Ananas comosus var. bracteatus]